jgi:hypothetical protein
MNLQHHIAWEIGGFYMVQPHRERPSIQVLDLLLIERDLPNYYTALAENGLCVAKLKRIQTNFVLTTVSSC